MPWPMVHFAISDLMFDGNPSPDLLLGSIAPDAVHVRGQISREEKGETHFVQNGMLPEKVWIVRQFNAYSSQRPEPAWQDFVLGYFTHIYTDVRWTDTLYAEFERECTEAAGGGVLRSIFTREVSQVEFELQRSMDARNLLQRLSTAKGFALEYLVTREEVVAYSRQKSEWLNDPGQEPRIQPIYFTAQKVNQFIKETAEELKEIFLA
ncbi:hypothetical protein SAMN05216312_104547 [Cohnella sp. OV330]|uniref:hypothetical protein n=1 Tax=Cohnella sp. OV330 TaxID=1855288 RepID=UPI0008E3389B|nr:hypothetical protein [Cohnella sp. OV330]SFB22268.1 hypothetical protein SAMN05216312_104547 [Cohnella sp. OV330]